MSNNRNEFVMDLNVNSAELESALSMIDRSLPNILETERDKVFEIAYLCEQKGIDFWKDNSIFRNIVIYDLNNAVVGALREFELRNKFEYSLLFKKNNNIFARRKIEQYKMFNDYISNYDIKGKFYELSCTYTQMMYPSSDMKNMFLHMYGELYHIGERIGAIETDRFNKVVLFSIVYQKEKDVDVLKKQYLEELDGDEVIEIVEVGLRNQLQFLEVVNQKEYEKLKKKYDKIPKTRVLK